MTPKLPSWKKLRYAICSNSGRQKNRTYVFWSRKLHPCCIYVHGGARVGTFFFRFFVFHRTRDHERTRIHFFCLRIPPEKLLCHRPDRLYQSDEKNGTTSFSGLFTSHDSTRRSGHNVFLKFHGSGCGSGRVGSGRVGSVQEVLKLS